MRKVSRLTAHILVASLLVAAPLLWPKIGYSAPLTTKRVTIANSTGGATTAYQFDFTIASVSSVGSIEFEYCTNDPFVGLPCTAPTGFSATGATLDNQAGETGFSIDAASTVNRTVLSRVPAGTSAIPVNYTFGSVVNPSSTFETVYVRIATFASNDGTGPRTDEGAVAFSTARSVSVSGYVPPFLTFCVGVTVALNCSITSGSQLNFGEFSAIQPKFLSSQFSVATNDPGGYSTTVLGTTMTSGNNTIPALPVPQPSQPGTSQFGMNLRANSNPSVGADPTGVGTGAISAPFAVPNQFYYNTQVVAASPISSDFNAFTVSYIVNINSSQNPGIYSTTLTYVAVAAF